MRTHNRNLVELVLQAADVVLELLDLLGVTFVHVVDLVPLLLDPDLLLELLLVALLGLILELVAPGLLLVLRAVRDRVAAMLSLCCLSFVVYVQQCKTLQ